MAAKKRTAAAKQASPAPSPAVKPASASSSSSSAAAASRHTFAALLQKALRPTSQWQTVELQRAVLIAMIVLSAIIGAVFGVVGLTGWKALLLYLFAVYYGVMGYVAGFHGVDAEEHGGKNGLLIEAYMPAIATFLLTWTLVFTILHA